MFITFVPSLPVKHICEQCRGRQGAASTATLRLPPRGQQVLDRLHLADPEMGLQEDVLLFQVLASLEGDGQIEAIGIWS